MADSKVKLEAVISATSQGMIDALKKASAAVNDSTASWKDRFSRAKGELGTVSDAVRNMAGEIEKMGEIDIKADPGAVERLKSAMSNISGVFGNVQGEVDSLKNTLVELRERASSLGMPIEEYQRFAEAVKTAGVDVKAAEGMMEGMRAKIQDFANGVPEAVELFGRLGVTLERLGQNSPADNFRMIADAINSVIPETEKAAASADMYRHSIDEVLKVTNEYNKALQNKTDVQYATDKDVQNSISLADAISKLGDDVGKTGSKFDEMVNKLNNVDAAEGGVAMKGYQSERVYASVTAALDAYNKSLDEESQKVFTLKDAYNVMLKDVQKFLREMDKFKGMSRVTDDFLEHLDKIESVIEPFALKFRTEFANIQSLMEKRFSIGGMIDTTEIDEALKHIQKITAAMMTFRHKVENRTDRIKMDYPTFEGPMAKLEEFKQKLLDLKDKATTLNFPVRMSGLDDDITAAEAKLDDLMKKPLKLRTEVDLKEIEELRRRLRELQEQAEKFKGFGPGGGKPGSHTLLLPNADKAVAMLKPLEDKMLHINGLLKVMKDEQDEYNRKVEEGTSIFKPFGVAIAGAAKGVGYMLEGATRGMYRLGDAVLHPWEAIKNMVHGAEQAGVALGQAVMHPVQTARSLADRFHTVAEKIKAAWQWMTRLKSETQGVNGAAESTGKQLGRIAGMLTGMGSKVMIIVKGLRLMVDAAKEVAKWFTEAAKRQAEMGAEMAGEAGAKMAENRRATEEREAAIKKYVELLEKANRSGKKADFAAADIARKELWTKHGVEANENNARAVFKEVSEGAYDERVDQNEAETRLYKELIPQWRKAIEERKGYLADLFGKGWNLDQKLGEDTVLTELTRKLGAAQKRLGELQLERNELSRTRRGAAYYDYVAVHGAENDDAMREAMRKQQEAARKKWDEREKSAAKADTDLTEWTAELTLDEDRQKIRAVWKKYNEIVAAGGDREKAYQLALKAIGKIREDAEKREADELKKLADEHEHQVESLQRAREQEQDAQKRLLESYKALYEAQENEAYRIRLEDIGKAHERLRKKMDRFGFTLPDGFKSSRPNMSASERRTVRMDDRIAEKLSRRQRGERVHFTSRELERIKALERLQKRDKALTAEEKAIHAAQTQASAAKTMKSASEQFWEAVKAFFEAATGKQLESEKEKEARKKKEKRERARRKNEERRKPPEQKNDNRPSGWASTPGARAAGRRASARPDARPAGARPGPPSSTGNSPAVFLDWESYLSKFKGSPQDAAEYYRKYVEMFNRMHGTSHEYKVGEFPNPYPEQEKPSGGVKLPPEYDNATRHQRAVAEWNRRMHPEDYDEEGYHKYSDKGMARARECMEADAERELTEQGFMMTGDELARELSRLYAPPRYVDTGDKNRKDYTALLERIETAIKNNNGNLTLK